MKKAQQKSYPLFRELNKNNNLKELLKSNSIFSITYQSKEEEIFVDEIATFNVLIINNEKNYIFDLVLDNDNAEIKNLNTYDNFDNIKERFSTYENIDILKKHLYNIIMNINNEFPNILFDVMYKNYKRTYKPTTLQLVKIRDN